MLSNKPYLIRAFYDWIVDSGCMPNLVVNTTVPGCKVPTAYVENNEITFNIAPTAIRDFKITKNTVEFRASFSGVVHIISVPTRAVQAIYAQENQQGMFFDYEEETTDASEGDEGKTAVTPEITHPTGTEKKRPTHLRLVD